MTDRPKFMGDAPPREDGVEGRASVVERHSLADKPLTSPASFPGVLSDREAGSGLSGPRGAVRSTVSETPGKPKRKAIPPHMLVSVAILQAVNGGLRCPLCTKVLTTNHKRILEHLTPVAFGGKNEIDNLRFVHAECAAKKTNGTPATSASGDIHKIRKSERVAVKRLPTAEIEVPVVKERWRWKKKIGGGVVRVRTR